MDSWLVLPHESFKSEFLAMTSELQDNREPLVLENADAEFSSYLQMLRASAAGIGLNADEVPTTAFWLVDSASQILGQTWLRHFLTASLLDHGGHIGYLIRPSRRRQGFGTRALALTLQKAAERGIRQVRMTCDTENIGSVRIIEHNGGVLSGYSISPVNGKLVSQYWIEVA